jgi:hypothetical protein
MSEQAHLFDYLRQPNAVAYFWEVFDIRARDKNVTYEVPNETLHIRLRRRGV